jgi:hypothetical protein
MNLSNFDGNTILGAYNAIAVNPVKRFADRKTAERRFVQVAQAMGWTEESMLEILRRHGPEAADGMDQSADVVDEANVPQYQTSAWRKTARSSTGRSSTTAKSLSS